MQIMNYTQISNEFLDLWIQKLSGSAVKIFLTISRKTIGWHKNTDRISYSQICEITGLCKNSVISGIEELKDNNLIVQKNSENGFYYELNIDKLDSSVPKIYIPKNETVPKIDTDNSETVPKIDTDSQKTIPIFEPTKEIILKKEEERKGNFNTQNISNSFENIKTVWNNKIPEFRYDRIMLNINEFDRRPIISALNTYTEPQIIDAVDNYRFLRNRPDIFDFNQVFYPKTLIKFFEAIDRFITNPDNKDEEGNAGCTVFVECYKKGKK